MHPALLIFRFRRGNFHRVAGSTCSPRAGNARVRFCYFRPDISTAKNEREERKRKKGTKRKKKILERWSATEGRRTQLRNGRSELFTRYSRANVTFGWSRTPDMGCIGQSFFPPFLFLFLFSSVAGNENVSSLIC